MKLVKFFYISTLLIILSACTPQNPQERITEVNKLLDQSKFKEAELTIRTAVNENPQNFELRRELVIVYGVQGKYLDAMQQYDRIGDEFVNEKLLDTVIEAQYMLGGYDNVIELSENFENLVSESSPRISLYTIAVAELYAKQSDQILSNVIENKEYLNSSYQSFLPLLQNFYISKDASKFYEELSSQADLANAQSLDWLLSSFLANFYYNNGKFEKALSYFDRYLSLRGEHHLARVYKASALISLKRMDEADELLQKMIAQFPYNPIVNQLVSAVKLEKGDINGAIVNLDTAISGGLTTKVNFLSLGLMHFEVGNYERAIDALERGEAGSITATKHYAKVLNYARLLSREGDAANIGLEQRKVANLDELREMANRLASVGDNEGFSNLTKAIKLDENSNALTEFEYAIQFIEYSDPESANKSLLRLARNVLADTNYLSISKNGSINLAKLMVLANELEREDEQALSLLDSWQTANPEDAFNAVLRSEYFAFKGNNEKALEVLRSNEISDSALYYRTLSKAYFQNEDYKNALDASKQALQLAPFSKDLIKALVLSEQSAKVDTSDFIEQLYANSPSNLQVALFKSHYYAVKGEYQKSLATLDNNYPAINPLLQTDLLLMRSRANFVMGNYELAREINEAFLDINVPLGKTTEVIQHYKITNNPVGRQRFLEKQMKTFPRSDAIKQELIYAQWENKDIKQINKLIESLPSSQENEIILANTMLLEGKISPALDLIKSTHQKYANAETAMAYADILIKVGNQDAALSLLRDSLQANTESETLRFYYATQLPSQEALPEYLRIIEQNPENFMALANASFVYNEIGNSSKALEFVAKALELRPGNATILELKKQLESSE